MADNKSKQMPVSGVFDYGNAIGKPESQGKMKFGEDLRNGGGEKPKK